jgi:hypothetical protein
MRRVLAAPLLPREDVAVRITVLERVSVTPEQEQIILQLGRNRVLAHQSLFRHRHGDETPPFHSEIINLWHGPDPAALVMVFREGGKSTIAEEAFVIGSGYQLFHNALIIGATERRACERLRAIKHEIETNELVALLFGQLKGHVWNEAEVILSNGVRIIAVGRGQSLRGTKHLHYRPDFCFCDDLEEDEHVRTPEARDETSTWFMSTVLPALDKHARIRVTATPLDREALPFFIQKHLRWPVKIYPMTWQPTFAFFDPARTVKVTSATTGWAVWSWIGNRLIVWDGGGNFWKPDEIVSKIFSVDQEYRPVTIGVETDGCRSSP